jgi:lysophospholipase L1-like esterase
MFEAHRKIVMLGNSHTFRMQWSELLGRPDVANRGVGSDVLSGLLDRLPQVIHLSPSICFIEGGINDIERGISLDSSLFHLTRIVDTLKRHGVVPVVTKLFHVASHYPESTSFNLQVSAFNRAIDSILHHVDGVRIIDLNPELSPYRVLEPRFAQQDGIHLTPEAYRIWGRRIIDVLSKEGF